VALTRAKHFLFVIARCGSIVVNPYWRDLVAYACDQGAVLKVTPRIGNAGNRRGRGRGGGGASGRMDTTIFPDLRNLQSVHVLNQHYPSHGSGPLNGANFS